MLISARQAAERLGVQGVTRRQARELLSAGFAGDPVVTRGAHLYDADRVDELAGWTRLRWPDVMRACPHGLFVARRFVDVRTPRCEQLAAVRGEWRLSPWSALELRFRVERGGPVPLVATVCGHVALGAEIQHVRGDRTGRWQFGLEDPGLWFEGMSGHRLWTGPGRPWVWWPGAVHLGDMGELTP